MNTWQNKCGKTAPKNTADLFHTAIVLPTRRDLAILLQQLVDANHPLTGAADHGVSEAFYLDDPDENGVELYWDRPKEEWPSNSDGSIQMYTRQLDIQGFLAEI